MQLEYGPDDTFPGNGFPKPRCPHGLLYTFSCAGCSRVVYDAGWTKETRNERLEREADWADAEVQ